MNQGIPVKLNKDPIIEAIFELRFDSNLEQVAELLPGILFTRLKEQFPKISQLPTARIPLEIRKNDQNLIYKPTSRLIGEKYNISIGEKAIGLSCPKPYQGWENFRPKIIELIDNLKDTNVIDLIKRFSVKYINIITTENFPLGLEKLNLEVKVGTKDLRLYRTTINTEFFVDSFLNIVSIVPGAVARIINNPNPIKGIIIDIDTIFSKDEGLSWDELLKLLDKAHDTEKNIFFELLKKETIEEYDPVWR